MTHPDTNPVYKVFVIKPGEEGLYSCSPPTAALNTHYKTHKWNVSNVGGFLCFDNLVDAVNMFGMWALMMPLHRLNMAVWKCLARDPVPLPKYRLLSPTTLDDANNLWNGKIPEDPQSISAWSNGTVSYRMVKPLECLMCPKSITKPPIYDGDFQLHINKMLKTLGFLYHKTNGPSLNIHGITSVDVLCSIALALTSSYESFKETASQLLKYIPPCCDCGNVP